MTDFFNTPAPVEDWTQFLTFESDSSLLAADNDSDGSPASAALGLTPQAMTPAVSTSNTPQSIESEQSQSLDDSALDALFGLDFGMPAPTAGISHESNDILAALAAQDASQTANTTFGSSFNSTLGSLGLGGTDALAQNELNDILRQFATTSTAPAVPAAPAPPSSATDVANAFAILDWAPSNALPAVSSPRASISMKRKVSETESEDANKRARSSTPVAKRPYRRQSKNTLSLSQLAAAASSGSPLVTELEDALAVKKEDAEAVAAVRITSTGKPSTARPKAVVPEKYMKNGEAQAITGMPTEQILAYPNWEALMQDVDETHRSGAEIFGKMITENRDKAKWAAKKSRDERKQKVDQLESQVDELHKKIEGMRNVMLGLVRKGAVDITEIEKYI